MNYRKKFLVSKESITRWNLMAEGGMLRNIVETKCGFGLFSFSLLRCFVAPAPCALRPARCAAPALAKRTRSRAAGQPGSHDEPLQPGELECLGDGQPGLPPCASLTALGLRSHRDTLDLSSSFVGNSCQSCSCVSLFMHCN